MNPYLLTQELEQVDTQQSMASIENGSVLFFPNHYYDRIEPSLMSPSILDGQHKNVSFDSQKNSLGGYKQGSEILENQLRIFMRGYADFALQLIQHTLPSYVPHLKWGRTSFRPAQIDGRAISKRKDDTRLHVDSFPATPVNGLRILRVFCNINPQQEPRVWNVGESFPKVLAQFAPLIPAYSPLKARALKWVKATKTLRSAYDHYMLQLHDTMKLDDDYQQQVEKVQIDFPAQSSWIVFTDQVSHAALSGQYLLEQTFYLPVNAMANPELSPFSQWKALKPELNCRLGCQAQHPIQL